MTVVQLPARCDYCGKAIRDGHVSVKQGDARYHASLCWPSKLTIAAQCR